MSKSTMCICEKNVADQLSDVVGTPNGLFSNAAVQYVYILFVILMDRSPYTWFQILMRINL